MSEFSEEKNSRSGEGEKFWSASRIALAALACVLIVVAASSNFGGLISPTGAAQPLPDGVADARIASLEGETFSLSDYRGKIVVLDVWATWCDPCRRETPHLVKIKDEYGVRGVEVIGLSVEDPARDAHVVRQFAREFGINYRLGWADTDARWFSALTRDEGAIPQTFVIGRDGRLYLHHSGYTEELPRLIRKAVERADEAES